MSFPPSFPTDLRDRAFVAANGELGIPLSDAQTFLEACRRDGIEVLGWELWLVHHEWSASAARPVPATGKWCGQIPISRTSDAAVISGTGDLDDTLKQISMLNREQLIATVWLGHIRFNFTLND